MSASVEGWDVSLSVPDGTYAPIYHGVLSVYTAVAQAHPADHCICTAVHPAWYTVGLHSLFVIAVACHPVVNVVDSPSNAVIDDTTSSSPVLVHIVRAVP